MRDMTEQQALAEAIRRWGPRGTVRFLPQRQSGRQRGRLARSPCSVGDGAPGSSHSVEGQGNTWLEAFEDARQR